MPRRVLQTQAGHGYWSTRKKKEAAARERQIKNRKNRSRLEDLIKKGSEHPDFQSGGS